MDSTRFRRPARAGCEWILSEWGGPSLARRHDVGLILGGPDLSARGHARLAALLLTRVARHSPTNNDSVVLHRALQHLHRALEYEPDNAHLCRALFTAYLLNGDIERGIRAAERCKTRVPALQLAVEIDLLRLALESGHRERLGARYDLLDSQPPTNECFAACLGAYHRVSGRLDHSRTALVAAHDRWPDSVLIHLELATTLWQSTDSTSALYHFSLMHDAHPDQPFTQWNLIAALAMTGSYQAARTKLEGSSSSVASDAHLLELLDRPAEPSPPASGPPLSGDLSTVSLADILHLLWNCRSFGTLSIDSSLGKGGLHFWKGRLVGAVPPKGGLVKAVPRSQTDAGPRAAVYRQVRTALDEMLSWKSGRFEFQALGEASFPATADEVALETPVVLLEAYADLDEKRR